jgi:hypothetical protein
MGVFELGKTMNARTSMHINDYLFMRMQEHLKIRGFPLA